ncbi:MAG TPA: hypothetical protein VGQ35_22120 [Dongiaceae bacterium]|jgi:hypothetical protein|nr:hypothetical protein [Dongiaceae bacterium]
MTRVSDAAWLVAAAATAFLVGCASSTNTGTAPQAAASTAACSGNFRAFGEAASQTVSLTCAGIERQYVAYPESIAHRYSPCSYTFDSAGVTGGGSMTCSNGASGPLSYDMTDPANIKVSATLDDGREMAFTLRQE